MGPAAAQRRVLEPEQPVQEARIQFGNPSNAASTSKKPVWKPFGRNFGWRSFDAINFESQF